MEKDLIEKKVASQEIFKGKVVHLFRDDILLPDGKEATREYIKHPGAVCIVPLTKDNEVILVKQYRYPFSRVTLEIPAGKLDRPDEDMREAALRELREETGIVPDELIDLGIYYGSPAIMGERIRMFLARGLTFTDQHLDEDEFLDIVKVPLDEVVRMILDGEITDGKTQAAILRVAALLEKEKKYEYKTEL